MRGLVLLAALVALACGAFWPSNDMNSFSYRGRVLVGESSVMFDWSDIEFAVGFNGTSISLVFELGYINPDGYQMMDVTIDNGVPLTINVTSSVLIASGMGDGDHTLVARKRTEALLGVVNFLGVELDGGCVVFQADLPVWQRRVEWIGDSLTCGYGDLGTPPCNFSAKTENGLLAWASLASAELQADYHVESWSGRGVVRNYGYPNITSPSSTMPDLFPQTLGNNASFTYDFNMWVPDAIVINLGTNDYSTEPSPPGNIFQAGYIKFVDFLASIYDPVPTFFLTCGPVISDPCCSYVENVTVTLKNTYDIHYVYLGALPSNMTGCDGHPDLAGQEMMADAVVPKIRKHMHWKPLH